MADYIRPTPRNPVLGLLADALMGGLAYMEDPRRTQQMRGVGGLLSETGIAQTIDRLASGEPLTKGKGFATRMKPETAAAAMTLGPEAVPIGRAAMRAVRATEGLPVGAGIVYHGSPYRFNRFDPTKIGSGEGAQAYGYGHYVAESPEVAKGYQQTLAPKAYATLEQVGRNNYRVTSPDGTVLVDGVPLGPATKAKTAFDADAGNLYKIDLPDEHVARMLDWDKPLAQQPEGVRAAAMDLGLSELAKGKDIYNALVNSARDGAIARGNNAGTTLGASQAGASEDLRGFGIPGIRYLDQGSRGQGKGTSNFVIFPGEEDLLRILSVNGGLLTP